MKTREAMTLRYSCKSYKAQQITDRELDIILQGANAAPIGMGKTESVKLTVIQNRELLDKVDAEGAKFFGNPKLHPLYGAPTLILLSGDAADVELAMCNVSCIIENMMVTAADIGLGSCYIRGNIKAIRNNPELCAELKVPSGFLACGAVTLGYPSEDPTPRELVTDKFPVEFVK